MSLNSSFAGVQVRAPHRETRSSLPRLLAAIPVLLLVTGLVRPSFAQDDVTTHGGPSGYNGAWITGPASNPLSFLNGPGARTSGSDWTYDLPDFSPMSELNRQLPYWLSFGLEERFRFESYSNNGFKPGNDDSYFLNRYRVQMLIRPTSWFRIVGQLQDARPFLQKPPIGPPNENRLDLKLAYAEIGDPERDWISVRVGRQIINYNNTLIADSQWRDQARSYDAAVANLHKDRYRLGIFAASVVVPLDEGISHHQEGNNIYGLYGGIDRIVPNSVLEPFVLLRVAPSVAIETTSRVKTGKLDETTYGLRWKGIVRTNLDYSYELAIQRGNAGTNGIRTWASTMGAGYRISQSGWRPRLFSTYDYASGDRNPEDGTRGTFDTLYPTAHDRLGISDQFGWQNISAVRGGATIEPHARWTLTGQYLDFWLASASDGLYNSSGGLIVRDSTGRSGTHVGDEFDGYTWYELNRHVNIGCGFAHLLPGSFLQHTTKGAHYNYPYFAINFKDYGRGEEVR
jgi:hypothetical protein